MIGQRQVQKRECCICGTIFNHFQQSSILIIDYNNNNNVNEVADYTAPSTVCHQQIQKFRNSKLHELIINYASKQKTYFAHYTIEILFKEYFISDRKNSSRDSKLLQFNTSLKGQHKSVEDHQWPNFIHRFLLQLEEQNCDGDSVGNCVFLEFFFLVLNCKKMLQ